MIDVGPRATPNPAFERSAQQQARCWVPSSTPALGTMTDIGETPEGFLKHAREFFAAADLVLAKAQGVSLSAYFLLGRSIELSLKAFLLHRGVNIAELRKKKLGHDLRALLNETCKRGLGDHIAFELIESGIIQLLAHDYADKRLEYRVTGGTYYPPLLSETWEIARKLAYELKSVLDTEVGTDLAFDLSGEQQ